MAVREKQKPPVDGPGMDGQDHPYRQQVASHYQISALVKSRLKYCVFFHYFLSFAMLAKLAPYVLDRFDWFILVIEELEVPEPYMWEWVWMTSFLSSIFCIDAIKKNNIKKMQFYIAGIIGLGIVPLVYGGALWSEEVFVYLTSDDYNDLAELYYWKDMPYGLLWYAFILLALQVHAFSLFFGFKLIYAWRAKIRSAD